MFTVASSLPPPTNSHALEVNSACPMGRASFFRISKQDSNRCFTACVPGLQCQQLVKNAMAPGTCESLGYNMPGQHEYGDAILEGLKSFPVCTGLKLDLFVKSSAATARRVGGIGAGVGGHGGSAVGAGAGASGGVGIGAGVGLSLEDW